MSQKKNGNLGHEVAALLKTNVRNYAMFIALAIIFIVFEILSKGYFLTARNLTNLINQTGYIAVMAVGMTLVLIICQIDLSVGFVAGFLGACAAQLLVLGIPAGVVIVIILIIGALIGLMQGLIIGKIGVPAFVTTLACEFIFRGLLTLVTEASGTVPVTNEFFTSLSNGFLPAVFRIGSLHGLTLVAGILAIAAVIVTQIRHRKDLQKYNFKTSSMPVFLFKLAFFAVLIGLLTYVLATYNGISWTIVITVLIAGVYSFVMNKTRIGRYVYGMGGNVEAASLSGVNVKRVLISSLPPWA